MSEQKVSEPLDSQLRLNSFDSAGSLLIKAMINIEEVVQLEGEDLLFKLSVDANQQVEKRSLMDCLPLVSDHERNLQVLRTVPLLEDFLVKLIQHTLEVLLRRRVDQQMVTEGLNPVIPLDDWVG